MKLHSRQVAARALELARLSPVADANPRVGCVIVDPDGLLLAEGYHRGAGTWHAEAAAINAAISAGVDLRGSTAYVTLEPCAHEGRTPSCARALRRVGVARVIYGQRDPNGLAAGGARLLREAGVEVSADAELARGSETINADWTFSVTQRRPFVRWKYASTLDGFSAASDGSSRWITGPAARADVHQWRSRHGAIVVGTGTVLADDPHLTTRLPGGILSPQQPLRVVVGDRELPPTARIFDDAARTVHLPRLVPSEIVEQLHEHDVHSVWLEGGPRLAAAFLEAGLVDEVVAYIAPSFLGAGQSAAHDFGARTMADLKCFTLCDVTTLSSSGEAGEEHRQEAPAQIDVRLVLRPERTCDTAFSKES